MAEFRSGKPHARISNATGQVLATGTTLITLGTVDAVEGELDIAASTITIVKHGWYVVSAGAATADTGSNHDLRLWLELNGTKVAGATKLAQQKGGPVSVGYEGSLGPTDVLRLRGEVTTSTSANLATIRPFLACVRVGPRRWT